LAEVLAGYFFRWSRGGKTRSTADQAITQLNRALLDLDLATPAPARVRAALRLRHLIDWESGLAQVLSIPVLVWFFTLTWPILAVFLSIPFLHIEGRLVTTDDHVPLSEWKKWPTHFATVTSVGMQVLMICMTAIVALMIFASPYILGVGIWLGRWYGGIPVLVTRSRLQPILVISAAVKAASTAKTSSWRNRPENLRQFSRTLRGSEMAIMRLHRSSSSLPLISHRRKILKRHARLVVAALRRAEAGLDSGVNEALHDTGALLIQIANRIAHDQIGHLLDDSQIENLEPARDPEPIRLVAAAASIAAAAVSVSFMHLPEGSNIYVIGGLSTAILAVIYGPRVHQMVSVFGAFRGG
jgi:hypothetical protein